MFNKKHQDSLLESSLHDEKTFYNAFLRDLKHCTQEVIIESPYITSNRMKLFYPIFEKLLIKGVKVYVVTRRPEDHENANIRQQALTEISKFERIGIQPLLCIGNHHRKIAILDRKILWEGSLNILSQAYSREIMRRMNSESLAMQMFNFLHIRKVL